MMKKFDYSLDYKNINMRKNRHLYIIGKGEQGVLLVEPYKSEILPHWRFKTPKIAEKSARHIYEMFLDYVDIRDFPGADMARKFLQMGFTRSRRYANHKTGQKYDGPVPDDQKGRSGAHGRNVLPLDKDPIKAESAAIFKKYYELAKSNKYYLDQKKQHIKHTHSKAFLEIFPQLDHKDMEISFQDDSLEFWINTHKESWDLISIDSETGEIFLHDNNGSRAIDINQANNIIKQFKSLKAFR